MLNTYIKERLCLRTYLEKKLAVRDVPAEIDYQH